MCRAGLSPPDFRHVNRSWMRLGMQQYPTTWWFSAYQPVRKRCCKCYQHQEPSNHRNFGQNGCSMSSKREKQSIRYYGFELVERGSICSGSLGVALCFVSYLPWPGPLARHSAEAIKANFECHRVLFRQSLNLLLCGQSSSVSLSPSLGLWLDAAICAPEIRAGTLSPMAAHQVSWYDRSDCVALFGPATLVPSARTGARTLCVLLVDQIVLAADKLPNP